MRNFKFRGKDMEGNWRYGNLMTGIYKGGFVHAIQEENLDEEVPVRDSLKAYVVFDSETIGQYTGLKEKNGKGKEVYVNDIIEKIGFEGEYYIVVFEDAAYKAKTVGPKNAYSLEFKLLSDLLEFRIVGNTIDNSELLNV